MKNHLLTLAKRDIKSLKQQNQELLEVLKRSQVLLDASSRFIKENVLEEYIVFYDAKNCDGDCLADECSIKSRRINEILYKSTGEKL